MLLTSTKKRSSPDTDATRTISSPGGERQSKRAKLEAIRSLGRRQDSHSEYHEPLRDRDANSAARPGYKRSSSMRPTTSPSKVVSSMFPFRAQSVPLGGKGEVRSIDFTSIPPSPQRSPSKGAVEIRRAPSVPLPDEERMDVDDAATLMQFTNPTHIATPRANPVFCYTVNFATPRGVGTSPRSSIPLASPLSPLTPLPPSPTRRFPDVRSISAKVQPLLISSNSFGPVSPTTGLERENDLTSVVTMAGDSSVEKNSSTSNTDSTSKTSTNVFVDLSSAPIIGDIKPMQGPSLPKGSKRVTRSVSMMEKRVKGERVAVEGATVKMPVVSTNTVPVPSSEAAVIPPSSTTATCKPLPSKSTRAVAPKSKPPPTVRRHTSVSKTLTDTSKLKQASLSTFVKAQPSAMGGPLTTGDSTASTSTSTEALSRVALYSSPSKIPLPASPSKRTATPQSGSIKPPFFSHGSATAGVGTGMPRGLSGRSLTTLSHALDKLAAPPPSRPNTSMGFVRMEGKGEENGTLEDSKGKGKAKDDASLPLVSTKQGSRTTFARPTASSLNRTATVTGFGSTATTKMRGRGRVGGSGFGRGLGGIFGRAGDRASKKTSLPVVAGSPVKGLGTMDDLDRGGAEAEKYQLRSSLGGAKGAEGVMGEEDVFLSQDPPIGEGSERDALMHGVDISTESSKGNATSQKTSLPTATNAKNGIEIDLATSPISQDKGKQRAVPPMLNPASSALHALSESLSFLPQTPTPPKPRVAGTRTGLRSSSAAVGKESPALGGSTGNSDVHGSGGAGPSNGTVNGSGGAKKSTLKILRRCAIFVDVRTEQGDDAGSLFVDMLKGLGARIMGRVGQKCTHIVYKNGQPNTLARYRMLNDPKPFVVGIAWVVECVEKRAKIDEEKFKVDVDLINVAGGNGKRRRSMFPKHLIPASPGPDHDMPVHISSEVDEDDEGVGGINGSPSQDPDLSIRSREDDLPPLERARRRRSVLPGGQTRLVP